jgi:hypothetical protein
MKGKDCVLKLSVEESNKELVYEDTSVVRLIHAGPFIVSGGIENELCPGQLNTVKLVKKMDASIIWAHVIMIEWKSCCCKATHRGPEESSSLHYFIVYPTKEDHCV